MKVVLLPLKDPAHGKQRLASHLTPEERQELSWADVLRFRRLENETRTAQVLRNFDSLKQHS